MDYGLLALSAVTIGGCWWAFQRIKAADRAAQARGQWQQGYLYLPLLFLLCVVLILAWGVGMSGINYTPGGR